MRWWVYLDQVVDVAPTSETNSHTTTPGITADAQALQQANTLLIQASTALLDIIRAERQTRYTALRSLDQLNEQNATITTTIDQLHHALALVTGTHDTA